MKFFLKFSGVLSFILIGTFLLGFVSKQDDKILYHIVDLHKQSLQFYWKDNSGKVINNFRKLKQNLQKQNKKLVFAMNGGMYLKDYSPQGLYIEHGKILKHIDSVQNAYGNFYMQPNGIFYINYNNKAFVCQSNKFINENILFATQSGPMLIINGVMHPRFIKGSKNLNIRNGVGILPNGKIMFAMSKQKINFYDFALFFQSYGCKNALYLDGFVSRTYLPEKHWEDLGGRFGVIIAETKSVSLK